MLAECKDIMCRRKFIVKYLSDKLVLHAGQVRDLENVLFEHSTQNISYFNSKCYSRYIKTLSIANYTYESKMSRKPISQMITK